MSKVDPSLKAIGVEQSKNEQHFFKTEGQGCAFSSCDCGGVTNFCAVIPPEAGGDIEEQTRSAIARLDLLLRRERLEGGALIQTVFLRRMEDRPVIHQMLLDYYGDHLPAITYVPQRPCDDRLLFLFEVWAMRSAPCRIRIRRHRPGAVSVDIHDVSYGFFGDILPEVSLTGAYDQSLDAMNRMRSALEEYGYSVPGLLRTWFYQGSIVRAEGDTQRYKELNRARTDFFKGVRFLPGMIPDSFTGDTYPASTGIGADGMSVTMAATAIRTTRNDVRCVPLENPDQTPAFDYGAVYSPQSPKFSRAMAVVGDDSCLIFVSGTASIVDSETKYIGDAAGQTDQTLANISRLIEGKNLRRHGIEGFNASLDNLAIARVYVKRPEEDFEKIWSRCGAILTSTPRTFTRADVCRDDLLVEIEGLAFCSRE